MARTRAVDSYDPATLASAAAELPGREFLQAIIDGRLPPPPIAGLIGYRLVSVGDGEALLRCTPGESTYSPIGLVHGGVLCTLLDSAAGCAVQTLLPPAAEFSSIEIKVSFLRRLRPEDGEIEVRGRALRAGRRVAFAEAHARDRDGELVGHATSSISVLRR
ncbi:MAG: PaaI family thioesterase [Solirubrobacterales bacterium]|nr:PaaI family thioesterase [Solirubrobacterales bacterium]